MDFSPWSEHRLKSVLRLLADLVLPCNSVILNIPTKPVAGPASRLHGPFQRPLRVVMRLPQFILRDRPSGIVVALLLGAAAGISIADDQPSGEAIFRDRCARCHGAAGEGTPDNYPDPLAGDKSIAQLTKLIHETMPEDEETKCSAEDAAKVAAYIYDAFYSADARVRNKPARVELSRLTVRQYQNAVADLIGSFRGPAQWGPNRGLRAQYFGSRYLTPDHRKFERADAEVHFDFGVDSPDPDKLDAHQFAICWQGSVLAPDTGDYEFVLRTEHAARLWVNDMDQPLIDALVKSGSDTVYRAAIHLLGGRAYPLKLNFSKSKQGVDDSDKHKGKPKPAAASISLEWKRPLHTLEVIPSRNLSVKDTPEVFVLQTRFPPDDRSVGYERGTSVSKAWDEATTEGAIEVGSYATAHLQELAGASPDNADSEPKLREFCTRFAERAFRRPLTEEQKGVYIDRQFAKSADRATAVKRVLLLVLKSPRFLYREIGGRTNDPFDTASRLSFGMWDSSPDVALVNAAAGGKLATRDEIVAQLQRMLPDLRTRAKLREFFLGWLKISQPRDLSKDPKAFPEFTPEVISDLRTSIELSLDEMLESGSADYRKFLLSDAFYLNGRLAKVYGAKLTEDAPFQRVDFEPDHRAGVLSHPYLLASLAYTSTSSPIHRGVFLSRNVLGRVLRPPAQSVAPLPPDVHADLSTRERVALQTRPEACQGCHNMINPLGFTMENFDAIGRYRETEKEHPIDATGSYLTESGEVEKFKGIKDLAEFLAASDESQDAFVKQLFQHAVKQPIRAYGPDELQQLQQTFVKDDFNIHKLLVEILASSATQK
jgi:mono/diheme cytochrome c family protein